MSRWSGFFFVAEMKINWGRGVSWQLGAPDQHRLKYRIGEKAARVPRIHSFVHENGPLLEPTHNSRFSL